MNDITSMNAGGLLALLGNGGMPGDAGLAAAPSAPGAGAGFQDLLGLVSDQQLADSQGLVQDDFLKEEASKLKFPGQAGLDAAMNSAQLQMALAPQVLPVPGTAPQTNVGPLPAQVSGAETVAAQEVLASVQDLGMQAQASLARSVTDANSAAPVAAWAAALAAGDVKAVELQATPTSMEVASALPKLTPALPESAALPTELALVSGPALPKGSLAKDAVPKDVLVKDAPVKEAPTPKASVAPIAGESAPATLATNPRLAVTAVAATVASAANADRAPENAQAPAIAQREVTQSPAQAGAVRSPAEAGAEDASPVSVVKPSVRSGRDFLLDRMDVSASAASRTADSTNLRAPALVGAAALASPESDRRISGDAVNFVAEKVENLRAQGGGQIRVELNTGGMGAIEIRVSMVRGQLQVKLAADRPETLKALQDSRSELMARLDSRQPASLELATMSEARGSLLRTASVSDSHAFSESLVDMRTASAERRAPEVHAQDSKDNFASGDWQRDERREQSRDRWAESFERQSA